mgnify:CR=1 FL=1
MLKQIYFVDKDGYLVDIQVADTDEPLPDGVIIEDPPNGLYRPKWTGEKWISSMTEDEYIDTLPKTPPREPTAEERLTQLEALVANTISNQIESKIMKGEI